MQSRMDKYQAVKSKKYERTKKNTQLYEDVYDDIYRDTTYQNMQVIDSAREIDLNKLKDIIDDKYDTRQYRTMRNYSIDEDIDEKIDYNKENKIYDINQIIDEAKNKRTFIEEAKEKQKYLNYIKENDDIKDYERLEKEEKELEELINTITIPKENIENSSLDLFSDLKGNENTIVTNPIEASFEIDDKEIENKVVSNNADKNFYTDSNMFTKNDFEDFNTLRGELKRSNKLKIAIIIILVVAILSVLTYYIVTNFVIK